MLNWVEVAYPHSGEVPGRRQLRLTRAAGENGEPAPGVIEARGGNPLVLFTEDGRRVQPFITSSGIPGLGDIPTVRFEVADGDSYFITGGDRLQASRIEVDRPSDLHGVHQQADYLMIAHARLLEAIEPLARFHRERGLEVAVIDVEDVYDEFNYGIIDPKAIRDFIAYAYHSWQPPAPRFVLLVGDASWDTKNAEVDDRNYANWVDDQLEEGRRFPGRDVPTYEGRPAVNDRQLIPTWNYTSHEGHSASDNWFVAVDGDDHSPDLAIGRIPVVEPAEVAAIVAKTIAYTRDPEPGPWHRNTLWITNESAMFQTSSDDLAREMVGRGYSAYRVYPKPEEASNELHQAALQERLNEGQLIVHFLGHGGRHIWRTGPPDYRKNHDLFTLDHVAQLAPSQRLTFVLSMTCYSAPFDHPNQDSIGETFLRVPGRGAVGVFAASWRNSPSRTFSQLILDGLTTPGTPVGVAIMEAKRQTQNRTLVETYNLLGDPAIPLAIPAGTIELDVASSGGGLRVTGRVAGHKLKGDGVVEWLDGGLEVVHSERVKVKGRGFTVSLGPELAARLEGVSGVRAWAMDRRSGRDAVGWWAAPVPEGPAEAAPAPAEQPAEAVAEEAVASAAEVETGEGA
ncbi:MAG TPA: C25 family cysteine peptidase, partial [Thermoanaerobaculales bacterium]|nr:C25 family cysteine peptidase [Thermoanaerobaculales bacterium]